MSGNIRLYNTSGYVELQAPSSATNQTLVLPTDSIQPGLVKIADSSFTAQASVSINNCFTSTYTNYKIFISHIISTSGQSQLRMRSSGTDNTASVYDIAGVRNSGGTAAAFDTQNGSLWPISIDAAITDRWMCFDIWSPQVVSATRISGIIGHTSGSAGIASVISAVHTDAVSFDGLTLIAGTGTITGTIRVYGYRN